jgi:hypothetical protein
LHRVDVRHFELHVVKRDVEGLTLPVMDREADAEAEVGAEFVSGEFPAVVADAKAERANADLARDVEAEARVGVKSEPVKPGTILFIPLDTKDSCVFVSKRLHSAASTCIQALPLTVLTITIPSDSPSICVSSSPLLFQAADFPTLTKSSVGPTQLAMITYMLCLRAIAG